jgi:hypothetical protein
VDEDDQRRRYDRITPARRTAAVAQAERMEKLLAQARGVKRIRRLRPV